MEIHRLTEMQTGYDRNLFNTLHEKLTPLKNSLVNQIDHRRLGVTREELLSYFDDKFIFVFNKYFGKVNSNVLQGYLINSLQTFKFRLLRKTYQKNYELYQNIIRLDDLPNAQGIKDDDENRTLFVDLALSFMKKSLTQEAYKLLELELYPPIYITSKIETKGSKIPTKLILEFLGYPASKKNIDAINDLRREISHYTIKAREYFNSQALEVA